MEKSTDKRVHKKILRLTAKPELPEHKVAAELDDLDRAIIEAQQDDPFFSYLELAERWNVTNATVRNRIKRLKAIGVIDVVTVINPYKIGYDTFALIGIKVKADCNPTQLVDKLQVIPGISGVTMVIGKYDLFVTYICRNLEEYRAFVTEEIRHFPEIEAYESFIGLDLYERKFLVGVVSRNG